jgi:hypothetical protein
LYAVWGSGGAITIFRPTESHIVNSLFKGNSANLGTVYYNYDQDYRLSNYITNTVFQYNTAYGAVGLYNASMQMTHSSISYTSAPHDSGAGFAMSFSQFVSISSSSITGSRSVFVCVIEKGMLGGCLV